MHRRLYAGITGKRVLSGWWGPCLEEGSGTWSVTTFLGRGRGGREAGGRGEEGRMGRDVGWGSRSTRSGSWCYIGGWGGGAAMLGCWMEHSSRMVEWTYGTWYESMFRIRSKQNTKDAASRSFVPSVRHITCSTTNSSIRVNPNGPRGFPSAPPNDGYRIRKQNGPTLVHVFSSSCARAFHQTSVSIPGSRS